MERHRLPTRVLAVDPRHPEGQALSEAGEVLRGGGLVAFPTETVYGLGANALDGRAVEGIFRAKGRPADNPLIVHLDAAGDIGNYIGQVPAAVTLLAGRFWPGPLTVVLRGGEVFPPAVTAGLRTVAFRVPAHPVARALIGAAGVPLAAPSANASGRPSPTTAAHVLDDLDGLVDLVLDGGSAGLGVESTVLDLSGRRPVILRPGGVTPEQLQEVLGPVDLDPAVNGAKEAAERPRSPGMKYVHYAPRAPLVLFEAGDDAKLVQRVLAEAGRLAAEGVQVGILACRENAHHYRDRGYTVVVSGLRAEPGTVAASLYESLRRFDRLAVDMILAEGVPADGMGLAVMNRLRRAAGGNVVTV